MLFMLLVNVLTASDSAVLLAAVAPVSREPIALCAAAVEVWQNGARAQVDPLGRGVWFVDDENDEVVLLALHLESSVAEPTMRRFKPGRWPEQLVVDPAGRVFVTARQTGQVFVIEPDFSTWVVPLATEPRPLALDVTRQRLYVGLVTAGEVVALDARSGEVLHRRSTLTPPDFLALSAAGLMVASRRSDVVMTYGLELEPRSALALGLSSVTLPELGLLSLVSFGTGTLSSPGPPARVESGVTGLAAEGARVLIGAVRAETNAPNQGGGYGGVSDPQHQVLVEAEAGAGGVSIKRHQSLNVPGPLIELVMARGAVWVLAEGRSLARGAPGTAWVVTVRTLSDGAQAVAAVSDQTAWVLTRDRRVSSVDLVRPQRAREALHERAPAQLPPSTLDPQLRLGRALFSLVDRRISSVGLACASCHPDGRDDGRTWTQEASLRQTPMLVGRLDGTAPYNWLGTSPTLEANLQQTITQRLAGTGLRREALAALARYVREGLRPVVRRAPSSPLIERGASIFADEEVGCAHCHPPQHAFTDAKLHDVQSVGEAERRSFAEQRAPQRVPRRFNTPSLASVALTAPYLHDGSAPSLSFLLEANHDRMGVTSHLSADEREALVAYLESL